MDYSVNNLMRGEPRLNLISVRDINDSYVVASVLNQSVFINTVYINRDMQKFKSMLDNLWQNYGF